MSPLRSPSRPPPLAATDALFLDIDGTLLDLAPTPAQVQVDAQIAALLPALHAALGGACALITGRALTDVDRIFPEARLPAAGQHGSERRDANGTLHLHAANPATLSRLRGLFAAFAARHDGLWLEDKGASLALHYRQAPQLAAHVHRTINAALSGEPDAALSVQPGKRLVEVRPEGRDKGTAIRDFLREPPFAGRRPVFLGDDLGDERGFDVIHQFSGISIKVGAGRTRARHRIPDVAAVRAWLGALIHPPAESS